MTRDAHEPISGALGRAPDTTTGPRASGQESENRDVLSSAASAYGAPDAIERWNVGLGAGAVAASLALVSPHFAISLAVGAFLEAVNFRGLARHARGAFASMQAAALYDADTLADPSPADPQGVTAPDPQVPGVPGARWAGIFSLRFVFLIGGMFYALWLGADPLGLVLGVSLIVPAAVIGAWLHRPPVQPVDPAMVLPPDDPSWDNWSVWRATEVEPRRTDEDEDE